ncbi:hypothetical protein [Marinobacter halophilus]|uniref:Uncharacterized protein n=1 Tax=Marinobacter halophilus TaxID=1323740 RepID=A0A2T1K845_9GAMM|nr:hypothetical protein [Marinobacter halophilus]PSF06319.1 hypothetical protein C7H08_14455 [Marinobacter halophilus]GGC71563.1 hypothetical protein GCM10011362_20090 [Marinobacter halophilus]
MNRSLLIKIVAFVLIIGGATMVLIKDDPQVPTGDINRIQPVMPAQESDNQRPEEDTDEIDDEEQR